MTDREEIFEAWRSWATSPRTSNWMAVPQSLHSLSRCDADLIFNLTESFDGDDTKEMNVVAYVDLLGMPYTGAGPHCDFSGAGQSHCQENLRFPRHQDAVFRHRLSRTHRARP